MKVIGLRKMGVIMWCVFAITIIMITYAHYGKDLDASALAGLSMITALGGAHTYKGKINNVLNGTKKP